MRFVQFLHKNKTCLGVELGENADIVNLNASDKCFPHDMFDFIQQKEDLEEKLQRVVKGQESVVKRETVRILAPITSCHKVLRIGKNHKEYCEERKIAVPKEPIVFNKLTSCIVGPEDSIIYPEETKCLDWEAELVIVLGKEGKNIKEYEAMDYVFGYTVANDLSARDLQMDRDQYFLGKAMDQLCPLGPAIVTPDELEDVHNLGLRCRVNGVIKQDSNTNQLIHKTPQILAFISKFIRLLPGDLILTGTPPGVGCFRNPPEYLKKGDVVEVAADKIGTIVTKLR